MSAENVTILVIDVVHELRSLRRAVGPVVVFCAVTAMGSLGTMSAAAASPAPVDSHAAVQSTVASIDEQEAMASYRALQKNLYEPSVRLYQGLPSNSCDPYSCLWPFTNAMAGTEFLYASPGASRYAPDVKARLHGLLARLSR